MMQSSISPQQSPFSADEESNLQDLCPDEEEYHFNEDEDEEEEESPTVHSHVSSSQKKSHDLHKTQLPLQEKLKERNQQILKKNQIYPLIFTESNSPISMKKLSNLSRPKSRVAFACYINERNILIVVLEDQKTIHIYSTINFNLILIKKSKDIISCLSYSKHLGNIIPCLSYSRHLGMIIVGGSNNLLQLWNPRTFEIEAESLHKGHDWFYSVTYVPQANIIVAKAANSLETYTTGLGFTFSFSLPEIYSKIWHSKTAQIQAISNHLLFLSSCFGYQRRIFLLNLRTKTGKESTNIFVPNTSIVEHTENNPQHIFSCLATPEKNHTKIFDEWHPFHLTQFAVDPKAEEFSIVRKTLTTHSFSKLSRLENSRYLLAQRCTMEKHFEMFMLSIQKDKVEIIKILSRASSQIVLNKFGIYILVKKGAIVEVDDDKEKITLYGYGCVSPKEESKENSEE